jgi:hypothetical protein
MIQVTYPDMRRELVEYLQRLADPKYQKQVWINGDSDGTVIHDELDYAVHYLYDDTALASDPHSAIGWILLDTSEALLIGALTACFDDIFVKYGTELSDAGYIELPEWQSVVAAAKEALLCISGR